MSSARDDPAKPPDSLDEIELPPLPGPAWPLVPGYEIVGEVGSGSTGTVYTARQAEQERILALKVLRADAVATDRLPHFHQMARAIAGLKLSGVVPILDIGDWQPLPGGAKIPFLASEFVPGGNLAKRLSTGPIAWPEAVRLVKELARTIHVCHGQGIVHGNLKPTNVLMGDDGRLRLTDFSLARKMDVELRRILAGLIPCTLTYLAPEQVEGKEIGPAADIYALGAILYRLIAGRAAFAGKTPRKTLAKVVNIPPPSLRDLQVDVPSELEALTLRCLAKSPEARPGSALELADKLRS
jgi:serine/threonine protein kinase